LKDENLKPEHVGYRPDAKIVMMQYHPDFSGFKSEHLDLVKNPNMQISKAEEPEKWNELITNKFPHIPALSRYSDAFIRNNPTLNTAKLCEMLF
jgi:hypothetical protein